MVSRRPQETNPARRDSTYVLPQFQNCVTLSKADSVLNRNAAVVRDASDPRLQVPSDMPFCGAPEGWQVKVSPVARA